MAENTNVIKQIKVGTSDSIPIGVDWTNVDGKPTFTWDSTNSTLIVTLPS